MIRETLETSVVRVAMSIHLKRARFLASSLLKYIQALVYKKKKKKKAYSLFHKLYLFLFLFFSPLLSLLPSRYK